jgi:adenylate cyclase
MWILTIRSAEGEPQEYILKPGKNTVGRKLNNDIIVPDTSASRNHAEVHYNPGRNEVSVTDLDSTNGTFLNRNRLSGTAPLKDKDIIRIGMCIISVQHFNVNESNTRSRETGTRPLTRELVLESFDKHSVLLYEIARQLNSVLDLDAMLKKVTDLMKQSMGADECDVILSDRFDDLNQIEFPSSIAELVITQRTAIVIPDIMSEADARIRQSASLLRIRTALCVPVLATDDSILALIYMYKTNPQNRPFDQQDIQLAVAIGHMAALTIERIRLLEQVREEQTIRQLLQRFVAPSEVETFWQDYLRNGRLPGMVRQDVTILMTDIVDSTGLAERLGTQRFGDLLSQYYAEMTEIIFRHGGMLNKYLGDGILAIFGMSTREKDAEIQAIRAGLAILAAAQNSQFPNVEGFAIGIGVNTGPVMAGYVGYRDRVEFAVVGDTVNVASRLQGLSKPNHLFIGPITRAAIGGEFETERKGEMDLRGRNAPIQVYEVIPAKTT